MTGLHQDQRHPGRDGIPDRCPPPPAAFATPDPCPRGAPGRRRLLPHARCSHHATNKEVPPCPHPPAAPPLAEPPSRSPRQRSSSAWPSRRRPHTTPGSPGDDEDGDGHPYVWRDGELDVRPQVEPHSGPASSRGGAPGHGGDARTQLAWSQWDADFSGSHIMLARGDGSGIRALTASTPGVFDIDPRISPDRRSVLFERDGEDGRCRWSSRGSTAQGSACVDLGCTDPCVGDVAPTWGPDGETIWFTRVVGPFDEASNAASAVLWTADLKGRHVRRVSKAGLVGVYEEYAAKFLPNGDRVVVRIQNPTTLDAPVRSAAVRTDRRGNEVTLTDYAIDADTLDVSPATHGPTKGLVVFETFGHHGAPEGEASAVATVPSDCPTTAACMAESELPDTADARPVGSGRELQPDLVAGRLADRVRPRLLRDGCRSDVRRGHLDDRVGRERPAPVHHSARVGLPPGLGVPGALSPTGVEGWTSRSAGVHPFGASGSGGVRLGDAGRRRPGRPRHPSAAGCSG